MFPLDSRNKTRLNSYKIRLKMLLKKGDFVEIDYLATDKETGKVVDLTTEKDAKEHDLYDPKAEYHPKIICLGENQVLEGIDEFLINKESNKEYETEIPSEKAFGKKDPKLMKIMPARDFKKQKITPFPGLQVRFDELTGTVRAVSGGRIIVDFNHPLAGHTLIYKIKVHEIVKDDKKKLGSLIPPQIKTTIKEKVAEIDMELPEPIQKQFSEKIKKLIPTIKELKFKKPTKI